MTELRTCGTRSNAIWGKSGSRYARTLAATLAVLAGLALASAPVAGAAHYKPLPTAPPTYTSGTSTDASLDASWVDASWLDASWLA